MGNILKREVIIRDLSIVQIKKDKEKEIGKIEEMTYMEAHDFKKDHATKYVIKVDSSKDNKPRSTHLLFQDQKILKKLLDYWRSNRDKLKERASFMKTVIPQRFKIKLAELFRQSLSDYIKQKKEKQKNEKQSQGIIKKVFEAFDSKHIVDMIKKWKTEANNCKNLETNSSMKLQKQLIQQDLQRKQDILKNNKTLKHLDQQEISKVMNLAISSAKIRYDQQNEKTKRSKKKEMKLRLSFNKMCLSSSIQFLKPVVDVYYIPNNNITQYATYKADAESAYGYVKGDPSPKVRDDQQTRIFNGNEAIFQLVFNTRMIARMSDDSYLWELQLSNTIHSQLAQLGHDYLDFNCEDINSYLKDAIKISIYDEMDNKPDKKVKFVQYLSVSDLIDNNVQSNNEFNIFFILIKLFLNKAKQLWINLSYDELKNIKNKILLEANIFRLPSHPSVPHNSFDSYLENFMVSPQLEMLDPIYPITLSNVPNGRLIKQSMNYFLEKVNQEGLGSTNSIKLLEFIIDTDQVEIQDGEETITRKIKYHIQLKLKQSKIIERYFMKQYPCIQLLPMQKMQIYLKPPLNIYKLLKFILSEDKQSQILEKVGDEQTSRKIYKIIKNIDRYSKNITYADLKSLFIIGVPSRYRCLYWAKFLHIDVALQDDIARDPGYQKNPNDLVERYKYYTQFAEQGDQNIQSFLSQNKEFLGNELTDNLEMVLYAFKTYLKFNRIVDLQYEDHLRFHLFKFIMRMFVSLYPCYMKTDDNLHSTFFQNELMIQNGVGAGSSIKKIEFGNLNEREQRERTNQIRAEIFWYSVSFYNLYYKQFISMEDEKGIESLKRRLAIGLVACEQLLNPTSRKIMQQNQLSEIIEDLWFKQYSSFFYLSFQSYNFTKILDIVVFEFGMNFLDGFENAIIGIFVTLLDKVKLDCILSYYQLQNAFLTEGLFVQNSFFVDLYNNINKISAGFDPNIVQRKIDSLKFHKFSDINLPSSLTEAQIARDRQEVQQTQFSHANLDTLETGYNPTSSLQDSKRRLNTKNAYAEDMSLSNLTETKQMKQRINVKTPYQVNRNEYYEEDSFNQENDVHVPDKKYLANTRVKIDQHILDKQDTNRKLSYKK